ncbi:MAG: glutamate formimidoyltransferase [Myxococcota bacterium]|nr:glutamate formimidoyltransferase [Myxococcota bacterium]
MSLTPIVECVPNFSEGRDPEVIRQINDAMVAVEGVTLLDSDPGEATHRTVVTLVGPPDAVVEAAYQGMACAARTIDMSQHTGAHPRMGATDVCPFVPVRGIDLDGCAQLARTLGERVGRELGIPVYLYEHAASTPERQNLASVRAGEYEGLEGRIGLPEWKPDFGPDQWSDAVARTGATAIGARPFLVAYNVNLNTKNSRKAMKIAALIREKGISQRDANGEIIRDEHGKMIRKPGMFKCVKAIGWWIEEYKCCQVSINFTNHQVSPIHEVVDAIRRVADQEGVVVTGSELVGLIPLEALTSAGRYYLERQALNPGAPESELIDTAIRSLGLSELNVFDPDERIIERRIGGDGELVGLSVRDFTDLLSSSAPAPGGGSVAALCGAMATGLSSMVGSLTTGKKGYEDQAQAAVDMAVEAQALREAFLVDVDADTAAFDGIMAAFGLPKSTDSEKAQRGQAIQDATRRAIEVPLGVLERTVAVLDLVEVALKGNENARSDAGVAALLCRTCAEGAFYNVLINVKDLKDEEAVAAFKTRAQVAMDAVAQRVDVFTATVREDLA